MGKIVLIGRKTTIKQRLAWMLLTTFMLMLLLKGIHYHGNVYSSKKAAVEHCDSINAVKSTCSICEFTLHESVEPHNYSYAPVLLFSIYTIPEPTFVAAYRPFIPISAHSPPCKA